MASTTRRGAVVALMLALGVAGGACGKSDGKNVALLQQQVSDLRQQLATTTSTPPPSTTVTSTTLPPTTLPPTNAIPTTVAVRHKLTGTLVVGPGEGWLVKNDNCARGNLTGYGDLRIGSTVTVRNDSAAIVGTGIVDSAKWINVHDGDIADRQLHFAVSGIPDADFYTVEVAHRGEQSYSRGEVEAAKWTIALSVG